MNLNERLKIRKIFYRNGYISFVKFDYYNVINNSFDINKGLAKYNDYYDAIPYYLEGLKLRLIYKNNDDRKEQIYETLDLLINLYDYIQVQNALLEFIKSDNYKKIEFKEKFYNGLSNINIIEDSISVDQLINYINYYDMNEEFLNAEIINDCNTFNDVYEEILSVIEGIKYDE